MSDNQAGTHFYSVYASQNGSNCTGLLTKADSDRLFEAVYGRGVPCGMWTTYDTRSVGIILNPRKGGVVLNMEPAPNLPHDGHGRILTPQEAAQHQQAGGQVAFIEPKDQRRAEVVFPEWSDDEATAAEALGAVADYFQSIQHAPAPAAELDPDPPPVGGPGTAGPTRPPADRPAPPPPPGPGVGGDDDDRTDYQRLQAEAKAWGVTGLNRKADELRADIARAKAAAQEGDGANGAGEHAPPA